MTCIKLCVVNICISVAYANMPYCIAKYCHVNYEHNPSGAHFHRLPKRCALRRQWLAKCGRPARQGQAGPCLQSTLQER